MSKYIIDEEKIIDLLETEWGYEGIREDISKLLRENAKPYDDSGDCISRSELKKAFEEVYPLATNEMGGVANKQIYDIINNAQTLRVPTLDDLQGEYEKGLDDGYDSAKERLARPKGEWEFVAVDTVYDRFIYKCSECGRVIDVHSREDLKFSYPFCHCGADMRKGDEDA